MSIAGIILDLALLAVSLAALYYFEHPRRVLTRHREPKAQISLAVYFSIVAICLAMVGSPSRALLLSLFVVAIVGAVSLEKAKHTPFNLVFDDLRAVVDGAGGFLAEDYAALIAQSILVFVALTALLVAGFVYFPADHVGWIVRLIPLALMPFVTVLVFRAYNWRDRFGLFGYTMNHCHVSAFFVSVFVRQGADTKLRLSDVADEGLALSGEPAPDLGIRPDIILIHHESTFDPRTYGIEIGGQIARFVSPPDSISGRLRVDTFGGNSWMTEFSLMTGISSRAFGIGGQYIFHRAAGRIKHAIPLMLKSAGYVTALLTTSSRKFLNYDAFYKSIGVDDRVFMTDMGPPFDDPDLRKHHSDKLFFARAADQYRQALAASPDKPQLLFLLTNFNHGPHTSRRLRSQLSKGGRKAALLAFPDEEYGEYYARMMFSAKSYAEFRDTLAGEFPDRPILIIRYGDHQPKFVKNILKAKKIADADPRTFETFYSIEAVNFALDESAKPSSNPLDIAFLTTVAMRAARMNLPPIYAAHEAVMRECGSNYQDTPSETKARFHHMLIRDGLIEAEPQR